MDRWRIHKLGFVRFWLYDREEFLLEDGHILLRGNNASGKSITTQSFIPFLLDGNRRPERLDPFGSTDRKMEFYLLGDDEREESTGYLYLEFRKDGLEEYLTIGIGMRAQRGKGIDFWGFCLNDGRRVGPGFCLYEKVGSNFLALSKQKLRNLLADDDNFVDSPTAYKALVNDRVFQFRELRQYEQLVDLLIKVRRPKLSKDDMKPSVLKEILNNSLRVLTDEDLSAMVSTMDRMDSLEDSLQELRAAMRDALIIRNEYNRYNQYMMGKKGQAWLDARGKALWFQNALRDAQARMEAMERELREQEEILLLDDIHRDCVKKLRAGAADCGFPFVRASVSRRKQEIAAVLACLKELSGAEATYEEAYRALEQAREEQLLAEGRLRDAAQQEQEERDALMEGMTRRREENQELLLSQEEYLDLKRLISQYRSRADWTGIHNLLDVCHGRHRDALQDQKNKCELLLEALRGEIDDLCGQLEGLRLQPEPVPPRRKEIQETRRLLDERNIPCAAFYEVVDFAPDLPAGARDLLEAQLSDAGLLDALVVREEDLPQVRELLAAHPDRFLLARPAVEEPVDVLVPDGDPLFRETVLSCLRGISRSDLDAETALLPDGRFRCGIVRGWSHAEGRAAGYVGAAARRANKERQIQAMEEQLARKEEDAGERQKTVERIRRRLEQLQEERRRMPTAEDLDQALEMLGDARKAADAASAETEKRDAAERTAREYRARTKQKSRDLSLGLPYQLDLESYREAWEAAERYQDILNGIALSHSEWMHCILLSEEIKDRLDDLLDRIRDQEADNRRLQSGLAVVRARIDSIREVLDRPENQERARRLAELRAEIDTQQGRRHDAELRCVELRGNIQHEQENTSQINERLREAVMDETDLEKYWKEELTLELCGPQEGEPERLACDAAGKVRADDRNRSSEQLGEALRKNYEDHKNTLLLYQPTIDLYFDEPAKPGMLRQRYCITLQKDGRTLSLYEFIEILQTDIATTEMVLEAKDRELFENILTETISYKLRNRIKESQEWTRDMTALMAGLETSMGLIFRLEWKPKRAEGEDELDTTRLVELLSRDQSLLNPADSGRLSRHFQTRVKKAREERKLEGRQPVYEDLIREVLDYRNWYEFHLFYERSGEGRKELTDRVLSSKIQQLRAAHKRDISFRCLAGGMRGSRPVIWPGLLIAPQD